MGKLGIDSKWHELTLGLYLPDAGNARLNLTGSWRSIRPVWNHERCVRCGVCDMFCPDAAIRADEAGYFSANLDYCKGCGICSRECVTGAIEMVQEEV